MNVWRTVSCLSVLSLAGIADIAAGQTQPVVRAEVTPGTVNVGESVELQVTVLVPTWFTKPPVYPNFELSNAITRLPPDSSNPVRERIGRDSWSGIVRRYRIYPLLGAAYRLSGRELTVTYANPGAEPVTVDVALPEVVFRGAVPAGAEGLDPYIAGRGLTLSLQVDGETGNLEAGDALVLQYVAELDGLPAIFLPSLAPEIDVEGVSVYAEEPEVEDGTPARRSERLTLVFDAGGEVMIPDVELNYWNTETASVETVTAAGFLMSVAGPPVATIETDAVAERPWWQMGLVLAALTVVVLLLWRVVPGLARRYRAAAEQRKQTEPYAFHQLRRALRGRDLEVAYQAMLVWLSRLVPDMDTRSFADAFGDESLRRNVNALSSHLFKAETALPEPGELEKGLAVARARCIEQVAVASRSALPSLNQ